MRSFNSRSREGATLIKKLSALTPLVSIHAPVKERQHLRHSLAKPICFNSRSREGATYALGCRRQLAGFNSRSREGATVTGEDTSPYKQVSIHAPVKERHFSFYTSREVKGFNSRSREGATSLDGLLSLAKRFNSRSREGAT